MGKGFIGNSVLSFLSTLVGITWTFQQRLQLPDFLVTAFIFCPWLRDAWVVRRSRLRSLMGGLALGNYLAEES